MFYKERNALDTFIRPQSYTQCVLASNKLFGNTDSDGGLVVQKCKCFDLFVLLSVIHQGAVIGFCSSVRIWCVHQGPKGERSGSGEPSTLSGQVTLNDPEIGRPRLPEEEHSITAGVCVFVCVYECVLIQSAQAVLQCTREHNITF